MSNLTILIQDFRTSYPSTAIYLRGDFNVSNKNLKRKELITYFIQSNDLHDVPLGHTTYHHFVGNGSSDSHLDRIMCTKQPNKTETLLSIECKNDNPLISSSHDAIISCWFPSPRNTNVAEELLASAPRLKNERHKTFWTDHCI